MIALRPYQKAAVDAAYDALSQHVSPLLSLPTGAGKSLCLAALCAEYVTKQRRVLVLSHRRELLTQDAAALAAIAPEIQSGVYSAGLERRDTTHPVIFGGVQSIYSRMGELQQAGAFGLCIIDEAHLIPRSADAMYADVFRQLPGVLRVGLTATPYRLDSGLLHEGEGAPFDALAIHIEPLSLVPEYLAPLIGRGTEQEMSVVGVHSVRGDFVTRELEQGAMDEDLIRTTVSETFRLAQDRQHWLVFCITVAHAEAVLAEMRRQGIEAALVTGETPREQRDATLAAFQAGALRALVNVNVLTTGFDAPLIDCLVMLRPTQSKGLWVQCLGRGMRKTEGKKDCVVLDFAGNISRHGSINCFAEVIPSPREERQRAAKEAQARRAQEITHRARAAHGDPMMGDGSADIREVSVRRMAYRLQESKKYPGKTNIVVDYVCVDGPTIRQWLCPEYTGGARWHAKQWFQRRGVPMPHSAAHAQSLLRQLPIPTSLTVTKQDGYDRVLVEHWQETEEQSPLFD